MVIGATVTDYAKSSTSFHDLPPEMMLDILSRLPVKALIRSTSVTKSWYSLIINPKFFAAQIRRSILSCDENAVFIIPSKLSAQHPCALFSVDTCEVIESFQVPFTTKTGTVKLVGSHNGLLCLTDVTLVHMSRDLYLWNPSVRRYKTIVSSCFMDVVANSKPGRHCVVGLGFHEPTDDYRIVRMLYPYGDGSKKVPAKVEIFSLRKNTWRKLRNPIIPRFAKPGGVFVDGSVYWLEADNPEVCLEEMWMLSFDFVNEVFGELKLPDKVCHSFGRREKACISLMKVEGSVAVCVFAIDLMNQVRRPCPCSIWVMSHEDGVVSWTRRFGGLMDGLGWPLQITEWQTYNGVMA